MREQISISSVERFGIKDLAAKRLLEEALQKSYDSLAITLDSIADGVISTDLEGHIVRMNRVAQQLTGWLLVEAKGHHLSEVFKVVDGELLARNGTHYLIEERAALIREHEVSSPSGIVRIFRDVTLKSKLEAELQQAKKLEAIGRLAGGIAHDFNNLLAGIMGYTEVLISQLQTDPLLQGYARSALETSKRAAKHTKQLLAFSRKGKMTTLPVDLHASIAAAVTLLQGNTNKRISIVTRLGSSSATVLGDPTLLDSALLNLGLNARDATPVGGVINIETKSVRLDQTFINGNSLSISPGEYIEINISDTGTGMSEHAKDLLFEPFFTTKTIGRGTGLGLAAAYGTIKEHHGAITVTSNLGLGTIFRIYLPLCKLSVAELNETNEENTQAHTGSGCILLVDDESAVLESTSATLEAMGYKVLLAENGMRALDIYKREQRHIRVVILDVVMPRLSGPDTFFALKRMNNEIRVIFSSGYTFDNGAHDLLSKGVFGFIQKPFSRNELYNVIQEVLVNDQSLKQVAYT